MKKTTAEEFLIKQGCQRMDFEGDGCDYFEDVQPKDLIEFANLQNIELQMRVKELERMVELEYIRRLNGIDDEKKLKLNWEEYKSNFLK